MIKEYIKDSNFLYKYFSDHRLMMRYLIVGIVGATVNIFSLYILTSMIGIWYITSALFSFIASLIVAFFLQKFWTFKDPLFTKRHALRQATLYTASSVSLLTLNVLFLYILVDFFGMWYLLAQFFSLGIVAIASFMFNKAVTFKKIDIAIYDVEI